MKKEKHADELRNLKWKYKDMAKKMDTSSSVDERLTSMGLPYSEVVMVMPLLPKFQVPLMDMYNGAKDPLNT